MVTIDQRKEINFTSTWQKKNLIIHVKKIHQKEITTLIPEIDMEGSQTNVIKFMKKFQVRYNYFGSMRGHCLGKKKKGVKVWLYNISVKYRWFHFCEIIKKRVSINFSKFFFQAITVKDQRRTTKHNPVTYIPLNYDNIKKPRIEECHNLFFFKFIWLDIKIILENTLIAISFSMTV